MITYRRNKLPGLLHIGDLVVFEVEEEEYEYEVQHAFLSKNGGGFNAAIFRRLDIDEVAFMREAYGYEPNEGDWPECRPEDMKALTRAVRALFALLNPWKDVEDVDNEGFI